MYVSSTLLTAVAAALDAGVNVGVADDPGVKLGVTEVPPLEIEVLADSIALVTLELLIALDATGIVPAGKERGELTAVFPAGGATRGATTGPGPPVFFIVVPADAAWSLITAGVAAWYAPATPSSPTGLEVLEGPLIGGRRGGIKD